MILIQDLDHFLTKYTDFYRIKPKFKCKVGLFSGDVHDVDIAWLMSLHICFKYIKGDNSHNYEKMRHELYNNIIMFHIASKYGLLHRTSLCSEGLAYVYIIFDKTYTPFDNCIDLKLLLYTHIVSAALPMQDKIERKEITSLVKCIHASGFLLRAIHICRSIATDNYIIADYKQLGALYDEKDAKVELQNLTKLIGSSCACGFFL